MYSSIALEHISNPKNPGSLASATHKGIAGIPGEGPHMIIWLEVTGETIQCAAYETYGCAAATACGSLTTVLLTGRSLQQANRIKAADIVRILGGLPEGKEYCARLAEEAVKLALQTPCPSK